MWQDEAYDKDRVRVFPERGGETGAGDSGYSLRTRDVILPAKKVYEVLFIAKVLWQGVCG